MMLGVRMTPLLLVLLVVTAGQEAPTGAQRSGACPPHSHSFPALEGTERCDVITFAGALAPGAMAIGKNTWWEDGLQLFATHVNKQGGLRLGKGAIGFVNISLAHVKADDTLIYTQLYKQLCNDTNVTFLLAPLPSKSAAYVREIVSCPAKLYLAADAFDQLNMFDNLFSVYDVDLHQWGRDPIDLLYGFGARTFAIAGKADTPDQQTAKALKTGIYNHTDTRLFYDSSDLAAVGQYPELLKHVDQLIEKDPDVFIGLGDTDTFETLLKHFWVKGYTPKCAFFIQGLAVTEELIEASYTRETSDVDNPVVYDQWMGTLPWSKDMDYPGRCNWGGVPDPYGDSLADNTTEDCEDRRWSRYLGSASNFAATLGEQLVVSGRTLTYYHAKAVATLLMVQLALELAPEDLAPGGWGMNVSKLKDVNSMRKALCHVDQETFFGRMVITAGSRGGGHNTGFRLGFGQFQNNDDFPTLIKSASFPYGQDAIYPAKWPCELTDWWCPTFYQVLMVVAITLVVLVCLAKICARLGSDFAHPQKELADQNVEARWQKAAQTAAAQDGGQTSRPGSPDTGDSRAGGAFGQQVSSPGRHRKRRGDDSTIHVMFTDVHLRELEPAAWREDMVGKGSYGVVYRATWRGQQVAVKELKVPDEPEDTGERARQAYRERLRTITANFVQEVSVCCDLAHPNLVRMLGYNANPTSNGDGLLLVQEFLPGKALDEQLYQEGWQPTALQTLKAAIDIARGMEYLHSAFQDPIIHRDLKSPNLLLLRPPPRSAMDPDTTLKISDFGLTRDKQIEAEAMETAMMTGCGSVLWMAPEILVAGRYNEQVDVFSFAMCIVELVDGHLPWYGVCQSLEVPHKVVGKVRPVRQLRDAEDFMAAMVRKCWNHDATSRPTFRTVRMELEEEAEARGLECGHQVFIPRTPRTSEEE